MAINVELLKPLKKNSIFVETGSYWGDGIQVALDTGFDKIISLECNEIYYNHCLNRFSNQKNVQLYLGDSSVDLFDIIKDIDEPVTFWLDAHFMCNDPEQNLDNHPGKGKIPLIDELAQIKNHHLNNHSILIDDIDPLSNLSPLGEFPATGSIETQLDNLKKVISDINENYHFEDHNILEFTRFLSCVIL